MKKFELKERVKYKKLDIDFDYIKLAELLEKQFDNFFILESLGELNYESRYVVIGFDPEMIVSSKDKNIFKINDEELKCENSYKKLQEFTPKNVISKEYAGGLVGYLSYEAVNLFESKLDLPIDENFGLFKFGVYTDGIILDKYTDTFTYFYYTQDRSELVLNLLKEAEERQEKAFVKVKKIGNTMSEAEHKKVVEEVKEEILNGNTFQCEVGFKTKYEIEGDTFEIYKELRKTNPSPYMYYVKFSDEKIIGASPEMLLKIRDKEMQTTPLAGTIKRGSDIEEDKDLAKKLLTDEKEIAEHNMLVDLHRNDIGKVARFGTVKVRKIYDIARFSFVQHISSTIVGLLDYNKDMFDAVASILPGGVLTGAPKIESIKIINRNEKVPRGPYGGALGVFGFNGDCTMSAVLRSLFISGNNAYSQTCSGIVYDSIAENEYDEVKRKLEGMEKTLSKFNF